MRARSAALRSKARAAVFVNVFKATQLEHRSQIYWRWPRVVRAGHDVLGPRIAKSGVSSTVGLDAQRLA